MSVNPAWRRIENSIFLETSPGWNDTVTRRPLMGCRNRKWLPRLRIIRNPALRRAWITSRTFSIGTTDISRPNYRVADFLRERGAGTRSKSSHSQWNSMPSRAILLASRSVRPPITKPGVAGLVTVNPESGVFDSKMQRNSPNLVAMVISFLLSARFIQCYYSPCVLVVNITASSPASTGRRTF